MHSRCLPAAPPALTKSQTQPPQCDETDWFLLPPPKREGLRRGRLRFLFWSLHVPPWCCQTRSSVACRGHGGWTIALPPSPNTRPLILNKRMHICTSTTAAPPPAGDMLHSRNKCSKWNLHAVTLTEANVRHVPCDAKSPQPQGWCHLQEKNIMHHYLPVHVSHCAARRAAFRHSGFKANKEKQRRAKRCNLQEDFFPTCLVCFKRDDAAVWVTAGVTACH